ncbi:hypothetical protein QJQ45_008681 [Haematococcus lacustris]|nr:hypothetical protein QJQ45_008681 [Haematococcus lacustris]
MFGAVCLPPRFCWLTLTAAPCGELCELMRLDFEVREARGKLANRGFEFEETLEMDGVSVCVHYTRPLPPPPAPPPAASSNSRPRAEAVAAHVLGLPRIGKRIAEQRDFVFNPATQIGASGLNNARRTTQRWLAPIQKVKVGGREVKEEMAGLSMERHGLTKQLVVFFGAAAIGAGPRGSDQRRGRVVLVVEHRNTRVSSAVNGQQPCEEELDNEHPTRPADWEPPAGQVEHRLLRPAWRQQRDQPVWGLMWCSPSAASAPRLSRPLSPASPLKGKGKAKGKAAKVKLPPQPGRWLDRDCNAALNMQRIGESRWRPLELCWWPEQAALPAKGKECPGLGYKRLRDKPSEAQQQQSAGPQQCAPT